MKRAKIYIMSPIGENGYVGEYLARYIEWYQEQYNIAAFTIFVNSPGGDYFEAINMYNVIKGLDDVEVVITGRAYSAAAFIVLGAKHVSIAENSFIMAHHPWMVANSPMNYKDMKDVSEELKTVGQSQVEAFAEKTGKTTAEIDAFLNEDKKLTAAEALEMGLVDEVISEDQVTRQMMAYVESRFSFNPQAKNEENVMNKELLLALGLDENATDEQVVAAAQALKAAKETESNNDDTDTSDPSDNSQVKDEDDPGKQALSRVEKIETARRQERITDLVDQAIRDQKILPADRETYTLMAKADFDKAKTRLDAIKAQSVKPVSVKTDPDWQGDDKMSAADYMRQQHATQ